VKHFPASSSIDSRGGLDSGVVIDYVVLVDEASINVQRIG
jgi:hypothetical protein